MPMQAKLVWMVTQSAMLSEDQDLLNNEALSLVSLTHVKSVVPGYSGHISPVLCLLRALHSLPAVKKTHETALMFTEISCFPRSHFPTIKHEEDKKRLVWGQSFYHSGCIYSCSHKEEQWVGLAPVKDEHKTFLENIYLVLLSLRKQTVTFMC